MTSFQVNEATLNNPY